MYLRTTIAALLIASARSQLCGFKSYEECIEDLKICRNNVTQAINANLLSIPAQFAEDVVEKSQQRVHEFFSDPFHAFQDAFQEDTQSIRSGVQASVAVTRILQSSIRPLLELINPVDDASDAAIAPVKIILQTLIILKNFTEDETLRNNSQIEKILDFIVPNLRIVNDDGIRCGADAVGGLLQFPLWGVAFIIGKIIDYVMNCYSYLDQDGSSYCGIQSYLVKFTLNASIWILQTLLNLLSLIPG